MTDDPSTGSHPDASNGAAVVWRNVRKTYPNGHEALCGVSLEVMRGEVVALLGTSGSGKTTLLKTVNRLSAATSGEITVLGRSVEQWNPIALRRAIGYVIQDVGLLPHFRIIDNVGLVPRLLGRPRAECRSLARTKLELVGLAPERFASLFPHQLSGGQRQRVGVARALAADPQLVLMDEPFGALDPITRRDLQDEFRKLQKRLGTTVILVTHDIREAFRVADRLALLDQGRLVQVGTAAALLERPANDFVRAFLQETTSLAAPGAEATA